MAGRPRTKMSIENRAKQFMPFAALKGLPDALAAKEKIVVEKIELSSDMEEELDRKIMNTLRLQGWWQRLILIIEYFR